MNYYSTIFLWIALPSVSVSAISFIIPYGAVMATQSPFRMLWILFGWKDVFLHFNKTFFFHSPCNLSISRFIFSLSAPSPCPALFVRMIAFLFSSLPETEHGEMGCSPTNLLCHLSMMLLLMWMMVQLFYTWRVDSCAESRYLLTCNLSGAVLLHWDWFLSSTHCVVSFSELKESTAQTHCC